MALDRQRLEDAIAKLRKTTEAAKKAADEVKKQEEEREKASKVQPTRPK